MRCYKLLVPCAVLVGGIAAAQTPDYSNVGRAPTPEEIRTQDIGIAPSGRNLPPGSGTAQQGAVIFAAKCAVCHGETGEGGSTAPPLLGGKETLNTPRPVRTIGSYWPFATTIWDYVNRAMPRNQAGSLKPDEVYALTAYLLYRNDIIREPDVISASTLPKVQMPNRNGFVPQRMEDIADARKRGCQNGRCP